MGNIREQITQNINEINEIVEMFYQQKTQEAYTQLDPVLGNLLKAIDDVVAYQQEHAEIEIDVNGLTEALKEALSAIEEKDAILMADVLKYEVVEKLEAMIALL